METLEITPEMIPAVLKDCREAGLKPYIQGPPGVGKTECARQFASSIDYDYVDSRLAYLGPQDFGFPFLDVDSDGSKVMKLSKPSFWPKVPRSVIGFDEFPCASKLVQNASLQILGDRRINDHHLDPETFIVLMGNRAIDRVNIEKLSSAVVNRIVNINVRADLNSWVRWANGAGIEPLVTAFLKFRPELLSTFNGKTWDGVSNFASPRTWEKASDITKVSKNPTIRTVLLDGALGNGPSAEYSAFLETVGKLPDLNKVLAKPLDTQVPDDLSIIYATAAGLSKIVTPELMENFITYVDRLPKEFAIFAIRLAVGVNKKLAVTPAFTRFIQNNTAVFNNA